MSGTITERKPPAEAARMPLGLSSSTREFAGAAWRRQAASKNTSGAGFDGKPSSPAITAEKYASTPPLRRCASTSVLGDADATAQGTPLSESSASSSSRPGFLGAPFASISSMPMRTCSQTAEIARGSLPYAWATSSSMRDWLMPKKRFTSPGLSSSPCSLNAGSHAETHIGSVVEHQTIKIEYSRLEHRSLQRSTPATSVLASSIASEAIHPRPQCNLAQSDMLNHTREIGGRARVAPGNIRFPPRGPAPRRIAGAGSRLFYGQPTERPGTKNPRAPRPTALYGSRDAVVRGDISEPARRAEMIPWISACQATDGWRASARSRPAGIRSRPRKRSRDLRRHASRQWLLILKD